MDKEDVFKDVMNLQEAEPTAAERNPVESLTNRPDIPALREQLAVVVATGKAKQAIEVQLTHEQTKTSKNTANTGTRPMLAQK